MYETLITKVAEHIHFWSDEHACDPLVLDGDALIQLKQLMIESMRYPTAEQIMTHGTQRESPSALPAGNGGFAGR